MKRILFFVVCISLIPASFAEAGVSDKNAKLIQAAQDGNIPAVQTALADGAEVNAKDSVNGVTALIWAAGNGHTEVVKLLLEKGADVNAKANNGETALMLAAEIGHTDVVKLLLDKGANVSAKTSDSRTALMGASHNGNTEIVKLLLEKSNDVNVRRTTDGTTALMMAAMNGHTEVIELLLEKGAEVNTKSNTGKTALMWAAQGGDGEITELLLEKGADVNAKTTDGGTALILAAEKGHREVVQLLLGKGAVAGEKFCAAVDKAIEEKMPLVAICAMIDDCLIAEAAEQLKDKDPKVRALAVEKLDNIPHDKVELLLIQALSDENTDVRRKAVYVLGKGVITTKPIEPLINALKNDKDDYVQYMAAWALGNTGSHKTVEPLIEALTSKNKVIRERAAEALGNIRDSRAIGALQEALKDKERWEMHEAVIKALGKIGDQGVLDANAINAIIAKLTVMDVYTRHEAAITLGKLGNVKAIEALIRALKNEDAMVAENIKYAQELRMSKASTIAIIGYYNRESNAFRISIIEALAILNAKDALPELKKIVEENKNEEIVKKAKEAIEKIQKSQEEKKEAPVTKPEGSSMLDTKPIIPEHITQDSQPVVTFAVMPLEGWIGECKYC